MMKTTETCGCVWRSDSEGTEVIAPCGTHAETPVSAPLGLCTRNPSHGPAEVPWSGQRLCWDCADHDLDLLAVALRGEDTLPLEDRLEALAGDLVSLAGNSLARVERIEQLLTREETWNGEAA